MNVTRVTFEISSALVISMQAWKPKLNDIQHAYSHIIISIVDKVKEQVWKDEVCRVCALRAQYSVSY